MTTNFQALGEHTAYTAQAQDAAKRLRGCLQGLARQAGHLADSSLDTSSLPILRNTLDMAEQVQRELREALRRANGAAALCGRPPVVLSTLTTTDCTDGYGEVGT